MTPLAFIANPLDRRANQRGDETWLAAQIAGARHIRINGDKTFVADGELVTGSAPQDGIVVFLGIDAEGQAWTAGPSSDIAQLRDLRGLAMEGALPPHVIGMLAQARSLVNWHERHGFCANCGVATKVKDGGYRRHCTACNSDHFPRTDPVIIIVATHERRLLLGRQSTWAPGMYSALAGFMEPGETIEDAARREVFEEAGIRLGTVSYVASQPWPYPSSLMIGLVGEALDDHIHIDAKEIEEARWFPFAEARMMVERTHPDGLFATHPFAIAHLLVRTVLQES